MFKFNYYFLSANKDYWYTKRVNDLVILFVRVNIFLELLKNNPISECLLLFSCYTVDSCLSNQSAAKSIFDRSTRTSFFRIGTRQAAKWRWSSIRWKNIRVQAPLLEHLNRAFAVVWTLVLFSGSSTFSNFIFQQLLNGNVELWL